MGYRKLHIEISKRGLNFFSEGTVRNYMRALNLKSKIRVNKNKRKN